MLTQLTQQVDPQYTAVRCEVYALLSAALKKPGDGPAGRYNALCNRTLDHIDRTGQRMEQERGLIAKIHDEAASGDLTLEFNRLFEFHGGMAAPPFETEYVSLSPQHALSQSATLADLAGFYKAFGLQMKTECKERPDHLAVELEFMHFLIFKELIALEESDSGHWAVVNQAQKSFINDHLIKWPAMFLNRLREVQSSGFYLRVAQLLVLWTERDREYLMSLGGEASQKADRSV